MTFSVRSHTHWWGRAGLCLGLPVLALVLLQTDWLHRWDLLIYDGYIATWSRPPADDIVIVAIDEQSLRTLGRWPWSRHLHADLIRKLTEADARGIAMDIVFAEPDTADPTADSALQAALAASGRVVLPVLSEQTRTGGQLVETLPLAALTQAAAAIGHVDVELDPDGIARNIYLKAGLGSPYWSTLTLALLAVVDPSHWQALSGRRPTEVMAPSHYLWQRDYRVLIPFAGPPGHFQQFSYDSVLRGVVNPAAFHDKYVLVGATAGGMDDALPTPVSGLARPMSGVEFNANVLDALKRGLLLQRLGDPWSLLLTLALLLLTLALYALFPPRWTLLLAALALLVTLAIDLVLLHGFHRWFPPAVALLTQSLSYPLWSWERLRDAVRSLFEKEKLAEATLHSIGDAVIVTDTQGVVEYLNPVAETMLGGSFADLRGQPLGAIFRTGDDRGSDSPVNLVALCLEKGRSVGLSEPKVLVNSQGREYAVRASAVPLRDQKGQVSGVVVALTDTTETHRLGQQMAYQATHDALTELPNMNLLRDRLGHAIARARHNDGGVALLHVDLDHFKKVNEGLGRAAGDTLLKVVASRLRDCANKEDTLARAGADEFIYLLEDTRVLERGGDLARAILQCFETPFQAEGHDYFLTASIGICFFPKDGVDAETLLKNADTAMQRAKEKGRDNFQIYAHDMHVRALERLTLEQELRYAIERNQLELHYQPQVSVREGRVVGVEALLRWHHPRHGRVSPMIFVPLAEESGLIEMIGEWALRTACVQAKAWQDQQLPALKMAVNMSARQFLRPTMVEDVGRILRETGLEPAYLELEITESLMMVDVESGITAMYALKAIGVGLSIDDFGTGYSSLNYLKRFPIDRLKIDKSFLIGIETNQDDLAITLAMIAMAHSMGLSVIAEGVENAAQLAFLRVHRCDEFQGYYFSTPVPAREIPALLKKHLEPSSSAPTDLLS